MSPALRALTALFALALLLVAPARADAYTVRTERPRIFLAPRAGAGRALDVATFRTRCTSDPEFMRLCQSSIQHGSDSAPNPISRAASYVVTNDAAACTAAYNDAVRLAATDPPPPTGDAHQFISDHGGTMLQLAASLDWCYAALSDTQRAWFVTRITTYADWYLANSPPDVFHDDMTNVWASIALAGLALAGTTADAQATRYLSAADTHWKTIILPAMGYAGDWWHEGMVYALGVIGNAATYAAAWSTATDEDIFAWAHDHANDLYNGYIGFYTYALRPDDRWVYFGDSTDNKQVPDLFFRPLVDMLTWGTGSRQGAGLSLYIHQHTSSPGNDYVYANGWQHAVFYDTAREATATMLSALPTSHWAGPGTEDVAVMRSGWTPSDTYVWLSCGDYFSGHQHEEVGAFQIVRHSVLTGSDGYYDNFNTDHWDNYYSQHSVHANTLAIYQPGELFPTTHTLSGGMAANVNDGGQRNLRLALMGARRSAPDLATYMTRLHAAPFYDTGGIRAFEHAAGCYDYVACDVTGAYGTAMTVTDGNRPKAVELSRQLVFVPPDTVIVFDRVEATDPSYEKRFLLHTLTMPTVNGANFVATNGPGRLIGQTVLPAGATTRVVTGYAVEGRAHPPSVTGMESSGIRLEVVPPAGSARDYFLHVLRATDPTDNAMPGAMADETATDVTLHVNTARGQVTLRFAKTGPMAGHFTVMGGTGGACNQDLGAGGMMPGPDGGVVGGDGGSGDGGGDAGGTGGDASAGRDGGTTGGDGGTGGTRMTGGCGCRVQATPDQRADGWAIVVGFAAVSTMVQRRRRRA